jgi:general L-amino acid transport system permease protein
MLGIVAVALGSTMLPKLRRFPILIFLIASAAAILVLAPPGFDRWGGLLLSLMLAVIVSAASLPLGVLLAFGRASRNPSLRACCTGYIEVMRSVPLILVVYWIWITVPLFLPDGSVSSLVRGMIGYTIFNAAYVAEFVRSGIQAVPRGQAEAAKSLGMSNWTVSTEIVLPQAIRFVQPALVGNVLDVFNGATLVFIIGLTDFLRAGQMILADPTSSGTVTEVYVFMFAVYFLIGSTITFGARRMEARMQRSAR